MKQIVPEIGTGKTRVADVPAPACGDGQVLVSTRASLISAGTERYVVHLAKASLFEKARRRPDQVRRILEKARCRLERSRTGPREAGRGHAGSDTRRRDWLWNAALRFRSSSPATALLRPCRTRRTPWSAGISARACPKA